MRRFPEGNSRWGWVDAVAAAVLVFISVFNFVAAVLGPVIVVADVVTAVAAVVSIFSFFSFSFFLSLLVYDCSWLLPFLLL